MSLLIQRDMFRLGGGHPARGNQSRILSSDVVLNLHSQLGIKAHLSHILPCDFQLMCLRLL